MRELVVLAALLIAVQAAPGGYYKQEYQFKKSSQTYNNNQLESKNDDEGYYGKQGDLDGRVTPQVEQHNQHSEFLSPAVDGVGHSLTTYNDRDLTPEAERAFRDHNLQPGSIGHHSYSFSSASRPGTSSGYQGSSIGHSNLRTLAQNLEYDMSRQVSEAIRSMGQVRSNDLQYLEDQLKANVTRMMQEAIRQQYGQQYGSLSSYDSNEYNNLRNNLESNLLEKLHDQARYSQSSSSSSSSTYMSTYSGGASSQRPPSGPHRQVYRDSVEIEDLNRHAYRPSYTSSPYPHDTQRPERISYGSQQNTGSSYGSNSQSTYGTSMQRQVPNYNRDFPSLHSSQVVVNPHRSVSEVMQKVQDDLSQRVRNAIKTHEDTYNSNRYALTNTRPDYNVALDDLKRELKYNLTRKLQDELDRTYGQQRVSGEYSFSQNAQTNANYRITDLDDLKKQAEDNLVNYLETALMQSEKTHQQAAIQHSQRDYSAHRPENAQSLTSDIAHNPNQVRYESRPYPGRTSYRSQSSWSAASSYGSGDNYQEADNNQLDQIRAQLQQSLQRQLDAAVYEQNSHSSYTTQSSSQLEQILTDELKRNLTRQLQDTLNEHFGNQGIRGGQSYTISSGTYSTKANYRQEDLNRLQQQLQEELIRNLREQLRQQQQQQRSAGSYGRREEYSSMSSSSSGGTAGGYQGSNQFNNTPNSHFEGQTIDNTENDEIMNAPDMDPFSNSSKPIRGDMAEDETTLGALHVAPPTTEKLQNENGGQDLQGQQIEENPFGQGQTQQSNSQYPEFLDFGQQPVDYDDDFLLGIQPVTKPRPQVSIHQPTTTTSKPFNIVNGQRIDRLSEQIQGGINPLRNGNASKPASVPNDLVLSPLENIPTDFSVNASQEDLSQHQLDDDYFPVYTKPSSTSPPALSLADVRQSFISQSQYANAPRFNPNQRLQRIPVHRPEEDFDNIGQQEDFGNIGQATESIEVPQFPMSSIRRHNPGNTFTSSVEPNIHLQNEPEDYNPFLPGSYSHLSKSYQELPTPSRPTLHSIGRNNLGTSYSSSMNYNNYGNQEAHIYQQEPVTYPTSMPNPYSRTRTFNSNSRPNTNSNKDSQENEDDFQEAKFVIGDHNADEFLSVEEEEAVTKIVPKLGFWQKIANGYQNAKQKVKDFIYD